MCGGFFLYLVIVFLSNDFDGKLDNCPCIRKKPTLF